MTRLYLVRHGETEWNVARRVQGQADPPLTAFGEEQARENADLIQSHDFCRVVSSDLQRARQTAALLGYGDAPTDPAWREMHAGAWQGKTLHDLQRKEPERFQQWRKGSFTPDGGESWDAFAQRIKQAIRGLGNDDDRILVVCHGHVVRAAVSSLLAASWTVFDTPHSLSLTVLSLGPNPKLVAYNNLYGKIAGLGQSDVI
ncbi:MAG: histidine phosphatase family protein [Alphaproteobacteria bacterium]|nr:histidine phosphatase family protein [Alphaproteobacteria bacterium]